LVNVYFDITSKKVFTSRDLDGQLLVVGAMCILGRTIFRVIAAHEIEKTYTRVGVGVQPFSQLCTIKPIGEYARSAYVGKITWF
jgi:hypothetical protein